MPSFDLVSEIDKGELKNALDQAQREVSTRYDFKGSDCKIEMSSGDNLEIEAQMDYLKKGDDMTKKEAEEKRRIIAEKIKKDGIKSISKMERFFMKNFSAIYQSI